MDYSTFGHLENEVEERIEQLRAIDASYAEGEEYSECPRCSGDRTIEVITRMNGDFVAPTIESLSCPLCSGTGEAEAERAQDWIIEIVEYENMSDEDEKYLAERKKIS